MAKGAPKAEKNKKNAKVVQEKKVQSQSEEVNFEVFTPKFYQNLEAFQNFYKEVLALKSKEQGTDLTGEYNQVRKRVSGNLESQSNKILEEQLADLQGWIEGQQEKVAAETSKIEEAYKANSLTLSNTGSFTDQQIRRQLQPIQAKIDQKNSTYQSYGQFLKRAKAIYS